MFGFDTFCLAAVRLCKKGPIEFKLASHDRAAAAYNHNLSHRLRAEGARSYAKDDYHGHFHSENDYSKRQHELQQWAEEERRDRDRWQRAWEDRQQEDRARWQGNWG